MKVFLIVVALLTVFFFLTGCTEYEPARPAITEPEGSVLVPDSRFFYPARATPIKVDGIDCIIAQSGKGVALSCNWPAL